MKKTLLIGAAFSLLLGGAALADPASSPSNVPATASGDTVGDPGAVQNADYDRSGPDNWRDGHHGWNRRGGPDGGWGRGGGGPDGPHFGGGPRGGFKGFRGPGVFLKRNNSVIAVKCAEGDSTQECVDAVKDLMGSIAETLPRRWQHDDGQRSGPSDRQERPEMPDGHDGSDQ